MPTSVRETVRSFSLISTYSGLIWRTICAIFPYHSRSPWAGYRILAAFFSDFAERCREGANRPGGPADGRIKPGDALVAVDGLLITTSAGSRRLAQATVGKPIRLTVRRAGEELDVKLVPAGRCLTAVSSGKTPAASWPQPSAGTEANAVHRPRLGIGLTCWPCGRRVQGATESFSFATPPEVAGVQPDGPGARAGVRPGDRILEIDGVPLTTREGGQRIGALREGQPVKLTIEREKQRLVVQLVPAW